MPIAFPRRPNDSHPFARFLSVPPSRYLRPDGKGWVLLIAACGAWQAEARADAQPATALPSVKVTATARPVQTLIDRKVYNIAADLQSVTGSAADVLNSLPSVEVDADGNVSLRGDNKITVLIDGKASTQLTGSRGGDGLLQLSANDIEKIEVMTNPPAQYRAEGTGGIINIITKKARAQGASGTLQASVGNRHRSVLGASGAYNAAGLSLSGALGLREDDRQRIVKSSLQTTDPASSQIELSRQSLDEHLRRLIPSAKAGVGYRFNDSQSLEADVSFKQRSGDRYFDQRNQSGLADGTVLSAGDRHSDGHEWSMSGEQGLRFKQKLARPDETLELSLHRSTDKERERYAYRNTASVPVSGPTQDHLYLNHDLRSVELALDYSLALSADSSLKLGYSRQQDRNEFDNQGDNVDPATGQIVPNPDLTNEFLYRQTVQAAYASYQRAWGDWTAMTGLRVEHTALRGLQLTTGQSNARSLRGAYPSLRLERSLTDISTLSLGYSRRLSRPDPEALNPYIDHQDIHNLRAGNPNLLPQDTKSLELGYRVDAGKLNYGATAYLRRSRNTLTDVTQLLSPDLVLTTKANLPMAKSGGMEFSADGPLNARLTYRLSGNLFHTQIDAGALGASGLRSTTGLNTKASLDYRPTASDTAQLSFSRADKRLTPQGEVAAINLVNVGYRRQLQSDLALVFTLSDAFNGQRFERSLSTAALTQHYERQQLGRAAYIGLTYVLGTAKKSKSNGFEYDQ